MRLRVNLLIYILACFIVMIPISAHAEEEPDLLAYVGSITVTIHDENGPVGGGSLNIYRVADVVEKDGNYVYQLTEDFAECDMNLMDLETEKLSDGTLAVDLAKWASEKKLEGRKTVIEADGIAIEEMLDIGLYLVTQTETAEGYAPINPFLVIIPITTEDGLCFNVDATPKVETLKKEPDKPDQPNKPPYTPPSRLPQTGQLWWPVPVLAVLGILCFMLGWKRNRS